MQTVGDLVRAPLAPFEQWKLLGEIEKVEEAYKAASVDISDCEIHLKRVRDKEDRIRSLKSQIEYISKKTPEEVLRKLEEEQAQIPEMVSRVRDMEKKLVEMNREAPRGCSSENMKQYKQSLEKNKNFLEQKDFPLPQVASAVDDASVDSTASRSNASQSSTGSFTG